MFYSVIHLILWVISVVYIRLQPLGTLSIPNEGGVILSLTNIDILMKKVESLEKKGK